MFCSRLNYLLLCWIIDMIHAQSQNTAWQFFILMSNAGMEFSPIDLQNLLLAQSSINSVRLCTGACHQNARCRTFDFDSRSLRCRLFEDDVDATGTIVVSNSSFSRVGSVELVPYLFASRGQPCSACTGSRYLTCMNNTCECPLNTYFDDSACRSAQYDLGAPCQDNTWCRDGLNFTCLPRKQCGRQCNGFANVRTHIY